MARKVLVGAGHRELVIGERYMSPLYTRTHAAQIEGEDSIAFNGATLQHLPPVTSSAALIYAVRDTRLRKVIQIIESEGVSTVQTLAVEVNLSSSHLQHLFKQQTGVCITQVLTEQRLRRAAQFLATSDRSVKEIAYAVGYEHASSFIRAFRRYFSQTPSDYRAFRLNKARA